MKRHLKQSTLTSFGLLLLSAFALFNFNVLSAFAQNLKTGNNYVVGDVQRADGKICVLTAPGRLFQDCMLNFYNKSFFSISINGQVFSNNDIIAGGNKPQGFKMLDNGTSLKIADTIRTTWITAGGFNIIQDVFPVLFEKSGQIVMRWSVKNTTSSPAVASCQWLNDLQISDPRDNSNGHLPGQTNSTDGPTILHQYGYHLNWEQFPDTAKKITTLPWFYMGFLWKLPDLNPGLSAQAYLDYPPIIDKKPSRMTIGDWYKMAQKGFGVDSAWPIGASLINDDAVLLEWATTSISPNKTIVIGTTSYGTGEYDICNGNMFGVLLYPHKIHWLKDSSLYSPNPFKLELYALNPDKLTSSSNSKFTLTVGANLNIVDVPPTYSPIGKTQTLPTTASGVFIAPNDVQVFDWYIKANPLTPCKGDIISSLKLTGVTSLGPPTFVRPSDGADTCEHSISIECAESDFDAPVFINYTDSLNDGVFNDTVRVYDNKTTDKGLKSISWKAVSGTDSTKFVITVLDTLQPCYNDKAKHRVTIQQLDSTIGGCFDFTFEDCLGNKSFDEVCMLARLKTSVQTRKDHPQKILLTPNPMTDHIQLKLEKIRSASVRIVDEVGHQLYTADMKGNEWNWNGKLIDGTTISNGSYIISISGISEDGTTFKEERLLIKQ